MSKVFISYSSKDREFVERLVRDLSSHGINVFYDQLVTPGESWAAALATAIESAEFLLVALSPDSVTSKWVEQETLIGLAREAEGKAKVIPILVRQCEITGPLSQKTYASFDQDYEFGLHRVLEVLQGDSESFTLPKASIKEAEQLKADVAQFRASTRQSIGIKQKARDKTIPLKCFIVMPFGDEELQVVYEDFVKPILEDQCGLHVERGDDVFGSNVIMDDIRTSIDLADLIVADLTGKNANVFYEVGICHALEKSVLLLAQSMDDVPFDLRHRRVLLYSYTPRGCKRLETSLRAQVNAILASLE